MTGNVLLVLKEIINFNMNNFKLTFLFHCFTVKRFSFAKECLKRFWERNFSFLFKLRVMVTLAFLMVSFDG